MVLTTADKTAPQNKVFDMSRILLIRDSDTEGGRAEANVMPIKSSVIVGQVFNLPVTSQFDS